MKERKVLISKDSALVGSSFAEVAAKYNAKLDFIPFFKNEPLTMREFRAQHVEISEYTAMVFSSKATVDAYFALCNQLHIKVPDSQKYFCTSDSIANYLQKHIVYRKRKIFFGDGTGKSIMSLISAKHSEEKFLIATSGTLSNDITADFDKSPYAHAAAMFVKPVTSDLSAVTLSDYDAIVLYAKADVISLKENFPDFVQGDTAFITFGRGVASEMEKEGLKIAVAAPCEKAMSVAKALELYLSENC